MENQPADLWNGDQVLRTMMVRHGLVLPDAIPLDRASEQQRKDMTLGGVPVWWALLMCRAAITPLPRRWRDWDIPPAQEITGLGIYTIEVVNPLDALALRQQIVGVVASSDEAGRDLRGQLEAGNVPVWTRPRMRQVRDKHIAVVDAPLHVAALAASCTFTRPRDAGPDEVDFEPCTLKITRTGVHKLQWPPNDVRR